MSKGRHGSKRSKTLWWFPVALTVLWLGIWGNSTLKPFQGASTKAAFPRASAPYRQAAPVHVRKPFFPGPSKDVTKATVVTVASGQGLWSIARSQCGNGNDWRHLAAANQIGYPWTLVTGEKIHVSC